MRIDKMTLKTQQTIADAQELAANGGHGAITPLHLLAALLNEREGGIIAPVMLKAGHNVGQIRSMVESELNRLPTRTEAPVMRKS